MPSMKPSRTHIAAGGTVAALGVLAAVAIGAGSSEPAAAPAAEQATPVEVRTVVVHRTVKVVRRQKPKRAQPATAPSGPAPAVQIAQAPTPVPVSQPAPASSSPKPLTTKSSGGGEREDDEGYEGGELVIRTADGERSYKERAGTAVFYPSALLHRVREVTSGVRLAAIGWVQSLVRDPADRALLASVRRCLGRLEGEPDSEGFLELSAVEAELARRWVEPV